MTVYNPRKNTIMFKFIILFILKTSQPSREEIENNYGLEGR